MNTATLKTMLLKTMMVKKAIANWAIATLLLLLTPLNAFADLNLGHTIKGIDQYKFRIGNWRFDTEATLSDGSIEKGTSTSRNQWIMGGKAIAAHFENIDKDAHGITVFVYNPSEDNWKLSYTSITKDQADVVSFTAKMEQGQMVERWVKTTAKGQYLAKGVYSDIGPRAFIYTIWLSFDEGKNWKSVWVAKASAIK